ncbi:CPBP family intramembrane glutamic endopeptidase [Saccharibacillus sacchari]|uniref:CPBP family intramembrane glutamic endopeptidase n=1 Tax=Saccharibacillus sacchari TaxID=456493 RepID=A0ACC6P8X7_9BACL
MKSVSQRQSRSEITDLVVNTLVMILAPLLVVGIVGVLLSVAFKSVDHGGTVLIVVALSMFSGFVLIPYGLIRKLYRPSLKELGVLPLVRWEMVLHVCLFAGIFLVVRLTKDWTHSFLWITCLQMFLVAVSEEFWARGVLCYLFKRIWNQHVFIILASSLSFAFLTHMNEPFMENLLYRLPGALIMGFIYVRTGNLRYTIMFHFAYNLLNV